jgi:hypothetical protein
MCPGSTMPPSRSVPERREEERASDSFPPSFTTSSSLSRPSRQGERSALLSLEGVAVAMHVGVVVICCVSTISPDRIPLAFRTNEAKRSPDYPTSKFHNQRQVTKKSPLAFLLSRPVRLGVPPAPAGVAWWSVVVRNNDDRPWLRFYVEVDSVVRAGKTSITVRYLVLQNLSTPEKKLRYGSDTTRKLHVPRVACLNARSRHTGAAESSQYLSILRPSSCC